MTINSLAKILQKQIEMGNGDLEAVCDYPLGETGDWSTVEKVTVQTIGKYLNKPKTKSDIQKVVYLDWRI